jgi:hypothetical protein
MGKYEKLLLVEQVIRRKIYKPQVDIIEAETKKELIEEGYTEAEADQVFEVLLDQVVSRDRSAHHYSSVDHRKMKLSCDEISGDKCIELIESNIEYLFSKAAHSYIKTWQLQMLYGLRPNNAQNGEKKLKRVAAALVSTKKRQYFSYPSEYIANLREKVLLDIKEHDKKTRSADGRRNAKQLSEFILKEYSVLIDKEELRSQKLATLANRIVGELFELSEGAVRKAVYRKNKEIDFEKLFKNAMEITKI